MQTKATIVQPCGTCKVQKFASYNVHDTRCRPCAHTERGKPNGPGCHPASRLEFSRTNASPVASSPRSRSTTLTSQQRTASADMLTPPEFSLTDTRGKHRRRVTTVPACVPGWLDRFTSRRPTGWWHSRLEGVDIPGPSTTSSESPQLKPTPSSDDSTLPPPCPYVFCGSSGRPCSDRTSWSTHVDTLPPAWLPQLSPTLLSHGSATQFFNFAFSRSNSWM